MRRPLLNSNKFHYYDLSLGLEDRPLVEEIRELSPSEIQQVNDLMAEAMKESPNNTSKLSLANRHNLKMTILAYIFF